MPKYCKNCGYVCNYYKPEDLKKTKCPKCGSKFYDTVESIDYFAGRTEKDMPNWEDVVRKKYLKGKVLNNAKFDVVKENERIAKEKELYALKHNSNNGLRAINNVGQVTNMIDNKQPVVECPYCHLTDTKKITGISKMGSVALWGIFAAGKVSKQWHCNKCKSDF